MEHCIHNPIIPGFYPDPSICRVGEDFYLICSSFELCPGIPLFHSRDLVHWEQLCNVMTPENGFYVDKNCYNGGVMAPTIRYWNGTYYIINANFADKGNFIVTAKDPAGPWSEPHYLTDVPGIDASIFFDSDGQCYIMGTGEVWPTLAGKNVQGIWAAKYDIENFKLAGEPVALWGGALAAAASPESPHLYHVGDYYYLLIAEGGTEYYHSVTVARSENPLGPYEGFRGNPIMTHRQMGRKAAFQNMGHADLVDTPNGEWYAVLLGSRLIDGCSKNLGRETFLVPVEWEDGWPLFSPETGRTEENYPAPNLPWTPLPQTPALDTFKGNALTPDWVFWGRPGNFWHLTDQGLVIDCVPQALAEPLRAMSMGGERDYNSFAPFLGKRRTQPVCETTVSMTFSPKGQETAGLAVIQAMNHQFHMELARVEDHTQIQLVCYTSDFDCPAYLPWFKAQEHRSVLKSAVWQGDSIVLSVKQDGNRYQFLYGENENALTLLCEADGAVINPEKVGCMVGEAIGVFASGNGVAADNAALISWFSMK